MTDTAQPATASPKQNRRGGKPDTDDAPSATPPAAASSPAAATTPHAAAASVRPPAADLQRELRETRAEILGTVRELSRRLDMSTRASEALTQRWQQAREVAGTQVERARTAVREADPQTRRRWTTAAAALVPAVIGVLALVGRRRRRQPATVARRLLDNATRTLHR
ncbi:hypothetical protein GCM10010124_36280 [Pilimelia terevasa]|uniref:DUF3618 domain-containing protein n=1 Tax=Pilimelia terevasa TaxID=53372 RepID=A0A8J3BVM3_9ACTN|nr:hypothetical protein [Pilimelia terevasa]GGK40294.1 hypothetical protein GCM10010124_36280 [Pilimelia terevasa]